MRTSLAPLAALFVALLSVSIAGCAVTKAAAPAPKAAPSAAATPAPAPVGEEIPIQKGEIPDGWKVQGPFGMGVAFEKPGTDAQIAFTILKTDGRITAKDILDRLVAMNAGKKGVILSGITVSADGNEAALRLEDRRVGVKLGRAVVRCFPGKTVYAVMTSGLWPEEIDAQSLRDFAVFLAWVRLE